MANGLLSPPDVLAPTRERYELLDLLGRGGMGEVYKAWDAELEMPVALKALRPSFATDPKIMERFRREAKLARRIKHVHVAQMHDLVEWRGQRYLSMEFVEGQSIKALLTRRGKFPVHVALALIRQTCAGVEAAHEEGVIHRDLKPHNVMVTRRTGRACILDFGIARELNDDDMTEAGVILGSPQYMSYEQLSGMPIGTRSDIYQLGLMLFEMVTGVSPFRAPGGTATMRALREVPPDPRTIEPRLPTFVAEAVLRCMQKWPEDRFASARDMLVALTPPSVQRGAGAGAVEVAEPELPAIVEMDGAAVAVSEAPRALVAISVASERDAVVDRLGRLGCAVTVARDGTEALQRAHAEPFALVVLGANLQGVDGLMACQVLKQGAAASVPVIIVLDAGDEGRTAFAQQAGAAAVVRSPLNVHALSRAVRDLVRV